MSCFLFIILIISKITEVTCQMPNGSERSDITSPSSTKSDPNNENTKFNLESGAVIELALKSFQASIRKFVSEDGSDFSIIIHIFAYFSIALFDSIAPYDRYAVGIIR